MPLADPSPGKPNPFFRERVTTYVRRQFLGLLGLSFGWAWSARGAETPAESKGKGGKKGGGKGKGGEAKGDFVLPTALNAHHELNVVLGRPTDKAITVSLLAKAATEAYLEFGPAPGKYARKTPVSILSAGQPMEVLLAGLTPNTEYFYRLQSRKAGTTTYSARPEYRFATQRALGSTFTFSLQGDSHPERMGKVSSPELYARTLQTAAAGQPDFHLCIGDDFSVEQVRTVTAESCAGPYLLQRPFLGLIGQTAPVFLMNGNHEQASLYNYNQTDARHDVAVHAQVARNKYFPTPGPDGFYSGCTETLKGIGPLKSYSAWTWGDALFVILDNYWHSPVLVDSGFQGEEAGAKSGEKGTKGGGRGSRDWWALTIGDAQYQWLKQTLEKSKAKYKFVFGHHVLGSGRGGVDEADLYEWGGKGRGSEGTFKEKRPGWELPIHQLMVKHKVTIFFQGHDHLFCKQEKDGIVYQELPMPSDKDYVAYNDDRYASGLKLPSSGHLNVTVSPAGVKVDYVRSFLPKDESPENQQGAVAHSYNVKPRGA